MIVKLFKFFPRTMYSFVTYFMIGIIMRYNLIWFFNIIFVLALFIPDELINFLRCNLTFKTILDTSKYKMTCSKIMLIKSIAICTISTMIAAYFIAFDDSNNILKYIVIVLYTVYAIINAFDIEKKKADYEISKNRYYYIKNYKNNDI